MNNFNAHNNESGFLFDDMLHDPSESFLFGSNDLEAEQEESDTRDLFNVDTY